MKRVLFVLTIVLSLISCTTEVIKEVNTESKKVYTVKYYCSEEGTPEDFMCEEGYVLTEKDLPDLNIQYHTTTWEIRDGIKNPKGYKVTSDIILEPSFEWDSRYRYFFRAGDFYIDDKGYKCSIPNGKLISSVSSVENTVERYDEVIRAYTGGQTTFLLCNRFVGGRDFYKDEPDDSPYSDLKYPSIDYNGIETYAADSFCGVSDVSQCGFNQYSIISTQSLYTNLPEIDFTHKYQLMTLHAVCTDGTLYRNLCLLDNTTKEAYVIYINQDGLVYNIKKLTYNPTLPRNAQLFPIKEIDIFEEWTGDWSKKITQILRESIK